MLDEEEQERRPRVRYSSAWSESNQFKYFVEDCIAKGSYKFRFRLVDAYVVYLRWRKENNVEAPPIGKGRMAGLLEFTFERAERRDFVQFLGGELRNYIAPRRRGYKKVALSESEIQRRRRDKEAKKTLKLAKRAEKKVLAVAEMAHKELILQEHIKRGLPPKPFWLARMLRNAKVERQDESGEKSHEVK